MVGVLVKNMGAVKSDIYTLCPHGNRFVFPSRCGPVLCSVLERAWPYFPLVDFIAHHLLDACRQPPSYLFVVAQIPSNLSNSHMPHEGGGTMHCPID